MDLQVTQKDDYRDIAGAELEFTGFVVRVLRAESGPGGAIVSCVFHI